MLVWAVATSMSLAGNDNIYIDSASLYPGGSCDLSIGINNSDKVASCQFDLYLPEGITPNKDQNGKYVYSLAPRVTSRCTVSFAPQVDGAIRVMCYSLSNIALSGNTGEIIKLSILADNNINDEAHLVVIKNCILSKANGSTISLPESSSNITIRKYVSSLTLDSSESSMIVGDTKKLSATVLPSDAYNKSVIWSTSDANVASVDANGYVTANSVGTVTITATAADGSENTASCTITVNPLLVSSISLDKVATSIVVGNTATLTATISPTNATNPNVIWSSNDTSIATVDDNGTITAKSVGVAIISATAADGSGKRASCQVTVEPLLVSNIVLNANNASIIIGKTFTLTATVNPANATNPAITWSSSDTDIAIVDENGIVTAKSVGKANITATAADGSGTKAVCSITVEPILVTGITLSATTASIKVEESTTLTATVSPSNATNSGVTWSSSNALVANVNSKGVVTGMSVGTATITATAADGSGITATCTVTVNPILASEISLNKTEETIIKGESTELSATVYPSNVTNANVTWSSSDESVATVNSVGVVTGKHEGVAVITATAADGSGVQASCSITVDPLLVSAISLDKDSLQMTEGDAYLLTATISPADASNTSVTWSSDNPEIVSVNSEGLISALSAGSAVITVIAADGSGVQTSCVVTVNPKFVFVESISLSSYEETIKIGDSFRLSVAVSPSDASNDSIVWSSSDEAIATVDSEGNVTAISVGTAIITVSATDGSGAKAECHITVNPILVSDITLTLSTDNLVVGDTATITATIEPANATTQQIVWMSSDDSVVTVDSAGVIQALSIGSATITATATDGSGVQTSLIITVNPILVSAITLDNESLQMTEGETYFLTATVTPTDASNGSVVWSSSDENVATVDSDGKVTAVSVGSAIITVSATDGSGVKAECLITVNPILISGITLSLSTDYLAIDDTATITATIEPANATTQQLSWASSDESVVTVDSTGVIHAVSIGTATITATATDGSNVIGECIITVNPPVSIRNLPNTRSISVYTLNGTKIMSDINNLSEIYNLKKGVYIIEGRKFIVK